MAAFASAINGRYHDFGSRRRDGDMGMMSLRVSGNGWARASIGRLIVSSRMDF